MLKELIPEIKKEYAAWQKDIKEDQRKRISISGQLRLSQLAQEYKFERNSDAVKVENLIEAWARKHGIWLEKYSPDNNTMGAFLHDKTVNPEYLLVALMVYEILFNFDNRFSNDLLAGLTPEERAVAKAIMKEVAGLFTDINKLDGSKQTSPGVVTAAYEVLSILRSQTDADPNPLAKDWFESFFKSLYEHLEQTTVDQNSFIDDLVQRFQKGEINEEQAIEEYFAQRDKISGMFVTTELIEHTTGKYVDRKNLPKEIEYLWSQVRRWAAFIGSIENDKFSFEKEVILAGDKFNMVPLLMALDPSLTLVDAILKCARYVNQATGYLVHVSEQLESMLDQVDEPSQREALQSYIDRARSVAIAALEWEIVTNRYQRWDDEPGIFVETDRKERVRLRIAGILKSGKPLPDDYRKIMYEIYNASDLEKVQTSTHLEP